MKYSLVVLMLGGLVGSASGGELRVGAAQADITPAAGTPMAGYYFTRAAERVNDPLYAKALVLDDGSTRAALVALDLIATTPDLVADARAEIERRTGITGDNVMISATHAHTGPVLSRRGARDDDFGAQHELAQAYRSELPGKIAEAVERAAAQLTAAKLLAAHGSESSIAFNRRFHMKDGSVGWNPGKLNPSIVKAAGTIDPDLPVLVFEPQGEGHAPIATYVNYSVHLDNIGGALISADLPGVLASRLRDVMGEQMVTLWTTGCCGDVNHIDVAWERPQHGLGNASRMGTILAAEVLRTWRNLEAMRPGALRVRRELVSLDLPEIRSTDVEDAKAIIKRNQSDAESAKPTFLELVNAYKVLDVAAREGQPWQAEVQVISLGDQIAWVSLPGEIFVELGLEIKQDSPFRHTVVAELANGSVGYVPSRRAYAQGNYEVISARIAEGSGERLVDAAVRMLNELHKEVIASTSSEKSKGN